MMAKKKGRSKDAGPASAPPSPAVVGLMVVVFAACFQGLPTLAELDDVGTYESLTGSSFVSSETLAAARAALALVIFATQAILFFGPGWEEDITYPPGSKLKECKILIRRGGTLLWFTVWSWLLLGAYFAAAAWLHFFSSANVAPPPVLRAVLVMWEVAAPNALLVTVVVTFVIWPEMKEKGCSEGLSNPIVLLQHNLNSAAVLVSLLVSSTPLRLGHAALAPLWGLAYVAFSWVMAPRIAPEHGAVYLYFFFDSTQGPKFGMVAHAALLACLGLFYAVAVGITLGLEEATSRGVPYMAQAAAVAGFTATICRIRD